MCFDEYYSKHPLAVFCQEEIKSVIANLYQDQEKGM
jgi:hypothetical protein